MIKQEGATRDFSTGATRQAAAGKGTPVLIPADATLEVAKHFEEGAKIHGARNWEKGFPLSSILDSLERHLCQEKLGMTDESHARAIAWNALVYLATKLRIEKGWLPKELDDMPKYKKSDYRDNMCIGPSAGITICRNKEKLRVYLAHPIRGGKGDLADPIVMQANNDEAKQVGAYIRQNLPEIDLYIPAEHEDFVHRAYKQGYIKESEILKVDCSIADSCNFVIIYSPDGKINGGRKVEFEYCKTTDKPLQVVLTKEEAVEAIKDLQKWSRKNE